MALELARQFFHPLVSIVPKLPELFLALLAGVVIIKLILGFLRRGLTIARTPKALSNIIISLIAVVLWLILFSELARQAGLSSLAVKISGSLLVLGLAVANGASSMASDIIAGVFLANDTDFEVGFKIKSGDIEGTIDRIDIRKTRIIDESGCTHIIPNSKLDTAGWKVVERAGSKSRARG
ncbi:MAG: putative MscS family protein YkuT [bacterium ADurb.Bin400]|nr:MAG: putative MscS family protein YkuT [bacterium ADurb.Bin400]